MYTLNLIRISIVTFAYVMIICWTTSTIICYVTKSIFNIYYPKKNHYNKLTFT